MLTWLRELAATVGKFDRSALEPGYALRCTAGVAIPLLIAASLGQPALGVPAAIGAFITGFTSLQGIYRTRLTAILAAAVGMSATSFIGALAAHSTVALVAATAVAGYALGTVGQMSPVAATVALNSFVAFVLFSSRPLSPAAAAQESGLVLAGGLIQAILFLIVWPTARSGVERAALADVYRKLAAYARSIATGSPSLPPITPFATARQVLADPQPLARAGDIARFNRLLEDSESIRKRLGALAAASGAQATRSEIAARTLSIAGALDSIAGALISSKAGIETFDLPPAGALEFAGASDLTEHVRDALEAATMLASGKLPKFDLLSRPRPGPYTQNHIDWISRDSLRFSLVLAVAMVLGRHFEADRGYWIPLTAALVLKPDFQTTFVRGAARIGGTLVGAVVASLVIALVHGHPALQIFGILLTAAAAYVTFNPNYALYTVAITSFVVIVLGMRGLPGTTTIDARLLDTLAGGALAMIGYVMLPSWEHKRTRALLADLLDAQRRLAGAILRAYAAPSDEAHATIERARTRTWKIRTRVEASIDRSRHEPQRAHTIGPARALRILAATQRFGLANLALETALETQSHVQLAGLPALAEALDAEMAELAAALRESRRARDDGRLRAALNRLETEAGAKPEPETRLILGRLRDYYEATSRIAHLAGVERSASDHSAEG
jgi:uncharacterized membrane protein YccC